MTKKEKQQLKQSNIEGKKQTEAYANLRKLHRQLQKLNAKTLHEQRMREITESNAYKVKQIAKIQRYNHDVWFKLDNAGLIYPAIARDTNAMFRLSVLMVDKVDPIALQQAVNDILPRFPTITASLKAGLFWWYLDCPSTPLVVEEQSGYPCQPLKLDHRRSMIRVTYFGNEIAIEYFHSATDGAGGTQLLNCLIANYLRHKGVTVVDRTNCPHYLDIPSFEEMTDSFLSTATNEKSSTPKHIKSMHMKGKLLPKNQIVYTKGIMPADSLKAAAKKYDATVTQYMTAVILQSIAKQAKITMSKDRKPIRLSVPCNLRKLFDSKTLRNFSSYFHCQYRPGDFAEVVKGVKQDFAENNTKQHYLDNINFNTRPQTNFLMRMAPLPLKNIVLKTVYRNLGYKLNSGSFSNLGVIQAPKEFADHVLRYEFSFGRTFCEPVGVTMATYNNTVTLICNSVIDNRLFEKYLFTQLSIDGVIVVMESNVGGSK